MHLAEGEPCELLMPLPTCGIGVGPDKTMDLSLINRMVVMMMVMVVMVMVVEIIVIVVGLVMMVVGMDSASMCSVDLSSHPIP